MRLLYQSHHIETKGNDQTLMSVCLTLNQAPRQEVYLPCRRSPRLQVLVNDREYRSRNAGLLTTSLV